jgi:hypothetical protein
MDSSLVLSFGRRRARLKVRLACAMSRPKAKGAAAPSLRQSSLPNARRFVKNRFIRKIRKFVLLSWFLWTEIPYTHSLFTTVNFEEVAIAITLFW